MRGNILKKYRDLKRSMSGYTPHIHVLVSKSAIINNLEQYRKTYQNIEFAPVLKSNAYGHGLLEVASIIDKQNVPFVCVDSLFEAKALRANDFKSSILVIGYVSPENIAASKVDDTSFAITSLQQLKYLAKIIKHKTKIHIKVDTGMHRQGIMPSETKLAAKIISHSNKLLLEGVCTHFADADSQSKAFTNMQIGVWEKSVNQFKSRFSNIKYYHAGASTGSNYSKNITSNVARLGIGLYGFNLSPHVNLRLKPALAVKSVISSVREISKGESVGYNHTFTASKKMKVATVPVGYFEGISRKLSNHGSFIVKGKQCPIVGRVSMNISSVDVSKVPKIKNGDEVIVISNEPSDRNSVSKIAEDIKTIPYEVLVNIPQHLKRILVD